MEAEILYLRLPESHFNSAHYWEIVILVYLVDLITNYFINVLKWEVSVRFSNAEKEVIETEVRLNRPQNKGRT
jgi:hypothetical protein